jgi:hypothetical protein
MHDDDESLASHRPPTEGTHPDIRLPVPAWAKTAAAPGGVPPMFAGDAPAGSPAMRDDALEA